MPGCKALGFAASGGGDGGLRPGVGSFFCVEKGTQKTPPLQGELAGIARSAIPYVGLGFTPMATVCLF